MLLAAVLLLVAPSAWAAPDLPGAASALVRTPLEVAGDTIGGVGLIGASITALVFDGVSLVDANRLSRPVLRGAASRAGHRIAWGTSWLSTRAPEALRFEDIERLPEPAVAYLEAAPGVGRLDTALTGCSALSLAVRDALTGPALVALRAVGARDLAERLARNRLEARVRALGPEPLRHPDG